MKRLLNIVISGWLAVLLLFGTTAKEYIHLFTDHVDTEHTELHRDNIVIEPEHHHCTFLSFTITDFVNDFSVVHIPLLKKVFAQHTAPVYEELISYAVSILFLRGPPALTA